MMTSENNASAADDPKWSRSVKNGDEGQEPGLEDEADGYVEGKGNNGHKLRGILPERRRGFHRDLDYSSLRRKRRDIHPRSKIERIKAKLGLSGDKPGENGKERSMQLHIPPRNELSLTNGLSLLFSLRFVDYTIWKVRTNYLFFLLVSVLEYLAYVCIFALIISGTTVAEESRQGKNCVVNFFFEQGHTSENYEIAFSLSWTTFSTVGYGAVSPSAVETGCWAIRMVCALEAFVGVIYVGYCGAIFFNKIGRTMSKAHVTFCSSICIQYGAGVVGKQDVGESQRDMTISNAPSRSEYPVLSLRMVNNKGNQSGWEIVDAELKGILIINTPLKADTVTMNKILKDPNILTGMNVGANSEFGPMRLNLRTVEFEQDSHPYFAKVWYARHVLNEFSPFVSEKVKEEIRRYGGWPPERRTHASIREALVKFHGLSITIGGTSNASGGGVFIGKNYEYEDIFIGYQFASVIYLTKESFTDSDEVRVDLTLAHDILPQIGGGNEPLGSVNGSHEKTEKTA